MHEVSSLIVGATLGAATSVWRGDVAHAFSPAGGLHHAMPDAAAGFCVYNDVSVAIAGMLDAGAERVAYVDIDVHHGDGVEATFWDDPRVLTISVHQDPRTLYPGTGTCVGDRGTGCRGDGGQPGASGQDGGRRVAPGDPLGRSAPPACLPPPGAGDPARLRHPPARPACPLRPDHRRAADGGGVTAPTGRTSSPMVAGWQPVEGATPSSTSSRGSGPWSWPSWPAIRSRRRPPVPEEWLRHVQAVTGVRGPASMTDGGTPVVTDWSSGYDPGSRLDQAILATRRAVFPHHGLEPDRD